MTSTARKLIPLGLFVFIAFVLLYPNPFGNNPDVILDESYFLTSGLASIEQHTLPGWEFSPSGAYYGGVEAYIDTLVLVPVLGAIVALSHFSISAAELWVALNTGELLHVLRLVSGALALAALAALYLYFKKRKIPRPLGLSLALLLFLLLGDVLVIEFLHTAKMWALYIILTAATSALFLAQEYYLAHVGRPLMRTERYVAFLIWSAVLTFFQSYVGAFSIALLIVYAWLLGHISVRDVWSHVRRYWYLFALAAATQVSFVYRAYLLRAQFAGISATTAAGNIDWLGRLYRPLVFVAESQPLALLLYSGGVLALIALPFCRRSFFADPRRNTLLAIAAVHPLATFLFFHVIVGFDILPRYAIMLALACSFSAVIFMSAFGRRYLLAALAASALLFLIVGIHALQLYWHPSSETVLLQTIEQKYNTPTTVFITEHSARRLTLPINEQSLLLLSQERQDMSRFQFLLRHISQVHVGETFKPLTVTAYLPEQDAAYRKQFSSNTYSVWTIQSDCTDRCTATEEASGACFELNVSACGAQPQEVNTLPVYLSSTQLGFSYIVRKLH